MDWPVYFKDQLLVGDKQQAVAVCSLWTLKELAAQGLDRADFSVCGQLYSKEGIKYIARNILANPRIYFLILCGQDKSKSGQALLEAFESGQFFDETIPKEAFSKLKNNVKIIDLRGEINSQKIKQTISSLQAKNGLWAEPQIFAEKDIASQDNWPAESSVFRLSYPTVAEAWPWVLKHIIKFGAVKPSDYGIGQKELLNLSVVITKENPANPLFADYFDFSKDDFKRYLPQILTAQSIEGVSYTYGARLRNYQGIDQIKDSIIAKLKASINSRQAIATTWQVAKDIDSKSPPCLILLQGLIQNDLFYLTAYFRSNDMMKAWPQNALALRVLQGMIAKELNLKLGHLTTISNSAHIYQSDWPMAKEIIKKHANKLACLWDERGNFVIQINQATKTITAQHYSPDGLKIGSYSGKTASEVYHQIANDLAVSQVSHAFDLASELTKAEIALKLNKAYLQDRPLQI